MSSIKKVLSRVVSSHTRSLSKGSTSGSSANGDAKAQPNGHANGHVKTSPEGSAHEGTTAAEAQQAQENGKPIQRPTSMADSRNLSFTELKEDRKAEREVKDEQERRRRKEQMKKAHDEVRLLERFATFHSHETLP